MCPIIMVICTLGGKQPSMLRTALFPADEDDEEMDVSMLDTTKKKATTTTSFGPKPVILQHR
jgi:hypothetical protein